MADILGTLPTAYKPLQHYFQTATEHDKRDPTIAYYCRLYGLQRGMELDKKSPDCRNFLVKLMNFLEQMKVQYKDSEAIQSEVVGQAYIENYCIKLFHYADTEDRASRFGKGVVKAFYTASMIMDVLSNFGELPEEIELNRKYAKWKATYLNNCLKNGITPRPGPIDFDIEQQGLDPSSRPSNNHNSDPQMPPINNSPFYLDQNNFHPSPNNPGPAQNNPVAPYPVLPPATNFDHSGYNAGGQNSSTLPSAAASQPSASLPQPAYRPMTSDSQLKLKSEDFAKAMKYCKFANSALQYEDAKTAIENLNKALKLLTTGKE